MKSCPFCEKQIQDEAIFCKFCRRDLAEVNEVELRSPRKIDVRKGLLVVATFAGGLLGVVSICAVLLLVAYAFSPEAADTSGSDLALLFLCPASVVFVGGGLFLFGFKKLKQSRT